MQPELIYVNTRLKAPVATRYRGAIWTLLILAPVISEVLSGSTRFSILFVLIPEVMVWGGGALLARELVRRWRAGTASLLCLGLALSVAEEFIIQQTSIAPLPFPGVHADYGRYLGVNWVYLLFMLGFESVWVVLIPVHVTELIFPDWREKPWLRMRGLIATIVAFLLGSRLAWYGWTQQARPRLNAAPYRPPATLISLGLAAIAGLILMGWLLRGSEHISKSDSRKSAHPWLIGIVVFVFAAGWFELIGLMFAPNPGFDAWVPLTAGIIWAFLAFAVVRYWSGSSGWDVWHDFAVSFGGVLGCMAMSDVSAAGWTRVDLIAKFAFQSLAVAGFVLLARKMGRREEAGGSHGGSVQAG
jgi:hypothetical protein